MATNKFKDVSPYVHINERHHHDTDWKHVKYLHNFSIDHTFNHLNHYINYHIFSVVLTITTIIIIMAIFFPTSFFSAVT